MDEDKAKEIRDEALKEKMQRGVAFEEMVRSKGWEYIKAYIETQIKQFANEAILSGFKELYEYNYKRGRVVGMRDILGEIESSLKVLEDEREKAKRTTAK